MHWKKSEIKNFFQKFFVFYFLTLSDLKFDDDHYALKISSLAPLELELLRVQKVRVIEICVGGEQKNVFLVQNSMTNSMQKKLAL